jgi:hypothetical protein
MAHLPVATWTLELNPSEKKTYQLHSATDLKITNAALGPELADANGRSTVILHIDNNPLDSDSEDYDEDESEYSPAPPQKLVLTSLTPGKVGCFTPYYLPIYSIECLRSSQACMIPSSPALLRSRLKSWAKSTVLSICRTVASDTALHSTIHLSGYLYGIRPQPRFIPTDFWRQCRRTKTSPTLRTRVLSTTTMMRMRTKRSVIRKSIFAMSAPTSKSWSRIWK